MTDSTRLVETLREVAAEQSSTDATSAADRFQRIAREALAAELERLRKDAERYRWLRDESDCDAEQPYVAITKTGEWGKSYDELPIGEQLDAAIDAAMTKEPRDG